MTNWCRLLSRLLPNESSALLLPSPPAMFLLSLSLSRVFHNFFKQKRKISPYKFPLSLTHSIPLYLSIYLNLCSHSLTHIHTLPAVQSPPNEILRYVGTHEKREEKRVRGRSMWWEMLTDFWQMSRNYPNVGRIRFTTLCLKRRP